MPAASHPVRALVLALVVAPSAALQRVTKADEMPDVSDVLKKPKRVFDQMNARIAALSKRLEESRAQGTEQMSAKTTAMQRKLQEQKEQTDSARRVNSELQQEIKTLQGLNKEKRKRASELMKLSKTLSADFEVMRSNVTVGQEFLDKEETAAQLAVEASPDVTILADLKDLDAEMGEHAAKEERMNSILELGAEPTSLLQLEASESKSHSKHRRKHGRETPSAAALLVSLTSSLGELSQQQNASEAHLNMTFEEDFSAGERTYAALMETQAALKAKLAEEKETQEKLVVAVASLQETYDQLKMRSEKLRAFLGRVATLEVQGLATGHISLLQEGDEELSLLQEVDEDAGDAEDAEDDDE